MAFSRWYQLPFQLALWEVLETLGQVGMRTVHCDTSAGWVLAESRTRLTDVGLVDISVSAHPTSGTTVSLTAEAYWTANEGAMRSDFDGLVRALDHRMVARAHHFAAAVRAAEAQGVGLDLEKGTDLGSRGKAMGRPRALGAILVGVLVGVLFLIPIPLQDSEFGVMLYLTLASPFFLSAVVIGVGRYAEGGMFLLIAGVGIGFLFVLFTFLISAIIILPAIKGATRAFGADVKRDRFRTLSEGSRVAPKAIEIEHRYT